MTEPYFKLYYSVAEAVKVSGIGRSRMYELLAAKKLAAKKEGAKTLISAASLTAYLEALPDYRSAA